MEVVFRVFHRNVKPPKACPRGPYEGCSDLILPELEFIRGWRPHSRCDDPARARLAAAAQPRAESAPLAAPRLWFRAQFLSRMDVPGSALARWVTRSRLLFVWAVLSQRCGAGGAAVASASAALPSTPHQSTKRAPPTAARMPRERTPSRRSRLLLMNTTCDDGEGYNLDIGGCEPCPAGFFARGGYCSPCPIETYQEQRGQTRCVSCPANSRRLSWEDGDSRLSCVCMPGFYSSERNRTEAFDSASWAVPGVECLACPRGAICPGYGYAPYNERLQCPETARAPDARPRRSRARLSLK